MKKRIENTPAPWTVGQRFKDETGTEYVSVDGGPGNRHRIAAVWAPADSEECNANARLIAAAPQLLAALNVMFEGLGPQRISRFEVMDARRLREGMSQAVLAMGQTMPPEEVERIERMREQLESKQPKQ